MISSSLVPIIASMVPAIMAVGNALGVVGAGAVAMAAAFGIAGSAAISTVQLQPLPFNPLSMERLNQRKRISKQPNSWNLLKVLGSKSRKLLHLK